MILFFGWYVNPTPITICNFIQQSHGISQSCFLNFSQKLDCDLDFRRNLQSLAVYNFALTSTSSLCQASVLNISDR